jgi:hypothetical protein
VCVDVGWFKARNEKMDGMKGGTTPEGGKPVRLYTYMIGVKERKR